ncbi:carboxylate-amine ligase [Arthrobacter crystallopoietes BAB-32]|uniref:Putative glutamate--cysteine ligase 2 n=1 Tax=Arthrobacter crystallopoietes BAB-32 TaxID=1246476 RepID=N1VA03_9MICC|nr:glutamate--cysteine ligase [Arthrobacter crystallopoietes]EMY35123.1 carboxylate-amine ligase [Arthrobacter crystallopoietes BAB-32]
MATADEHVQPYIPGTEARTFGVEEELLLVDSVSSLPLAAAENAVRMHEQNATLDLEGTAGFQVTLEVKQEQVEVVCPPQLTLEDQIHAIAHGRSLADSAAGQAGARAVALATSPHAVLPHLVQNPRYRKMSEQFGLTLQELLTCGFHVHTGVASREEGVAVIDRIRIWLPAILALSSNSPFWNGADSGYNSYRYQVWNRWPTAGPTEVFGSPNEYDRQVEALLATSVPLDKGMIYFDARLSATYPTVEVRLADVCMDHRHAAGLAAVIRALVESAARQWRSGVAAPAVTAAELRAWAWQASRSGVDGKLVDPTSGRPCAAGDVVAELLEFIQPVLRDWEEETLVESIVTGILRDGPGARRQREAYSESGDLASVMLQALELTHQDGPYAQ